MKMKSTVLYSFIIVYMSTRWQVETGSINKQAVETGSINKQAVKTSSINKQAVETGSINKQAVKTGSINKQALNVEQIGGYMLFKEAKWGKQFLLLKPKGRRTWVLPHGPTNPGEHEYEAARRNLEEKTGIPKDAVKEVPMYDRVIKRRSGPNVTKITYLVGELAKPDANNISITPEFTNFQWMYIKDMDKRVSQITEDALAETDWLVY